MTQHHATASTLDSPMTPLAATDCSPNENDLLIRRSRVRNPPGSLTCATAPALGAGDSAGDYPVLYAGRDFCRTVIYGLVDPREPHRVRYVGKAVRAALRFAQHFIDGGPRGNWFADMERDGVLPDMVLLEESDKSARGRELHWFNLLRSLGQADLNVQRPLDRLDFLSDEERGITRERARAILAAQETAFPGSTSPRTVSPSLQGRPAALSVAVSASVAGVSAGGER
jgi:hypothetical protein